MAPVDRTLGVTKMWTVDGVVDEALRSLGDRPELVSEVPAEQARAVVDRAMDVFVSGKPRVWWLALKQPFRSVPVDRTPEFQYLADAWPARHERAYFIPENEAVAYRVFSASLDGVRAILSRACFFEYYVVTDDYRWLLAESDHDELFIACS